ncbi:hypothetical protein BRC65_08875 [Halobacteriales archaeon QH_2_65_14]|nr:MAG: hypothetical protein BRC65_08875 [Halobacteriales archaeon QH_2_65_14]
MQLPDLHRVAVIERFVGEIAGHRPRLERREPRQHIGNALGWCYMDFAARYLRLAGDDVLFLQGWDCHGLPTEVKVEGGRRGYAVLRRVPGCRRRRHRGPGKEGKRGGERGWGKGDKWHPKRVHPEIADSSIRTFWSRTCAQSGGFRYISVTDYPKK